jgi:putative transposase
MARKRYTPETIIRKLREAEVLQGQGKTIAEVVKQILREVVEGKY